MPPEFSTKDQRYRARNLAQIREKDRLRAATRRRQQKCSKDSTKEGRSAQPPPSPPRNLPVMPTPPVAVPKHTPSRSSDRAVDLIRETREMVWEWTKGRGPVSDWSAAFIADHQDGEYNGRLDDIRRDWRTQVGVGKSLVKELQRVAESRLPQDEESLRDVVRETIDLMRTLLTGIATAEAHLALYKYGK